MPTLKALQAQGKSKVNKANALDILRFYTVFNTEYRLIEDKVEEAQDEIDEIDASTHGVSQAARAALSEFILEQAGRLDLLNGNLRGGRRPT